MIYELSRRTSAALAIALSTALLSTLALAADDGGEFRAILKKNDCFNCHAIDKTKKGPAYKKIAAKYKGKTAEGEAKMYKNVTTGPKVKLEDGTEEEHKVIEASDQEIKGLIKWILSL